MSDKTDENIVNNIDEEEDEDSDEETDNEESDDETEEDNDENDDEFDEESDDKTDVDDDDVVDSQLSDELLTTSDSEITCYICLNPFNGQEVGSPDSCDSIHHFCLDCIEEWSKQINTCPVDRKRFNIIIVRREIGSNIIMKLPIVQNIVPEVESVPEDVTFCEICGRCDREDRLLLCDGCDFGYHCECLSPPLETIPIEEWFCPDCYERLFGTENGNGLAVNPHRRRAIARTGASEAVRQRILQRRTQRTQRRKTTKTKTRKKYRKRKVKRKSSSKSKTTKTKTGRKRKTRRRRKKRRTKKSVLASRPLPAADARTRIASKLGIGAVPKSPFGLPTMKNLAYESIRRITDMRSAAGISHLSMFGSELDNYDPRIMTEEDIEFGTDGVVARARVGRIQSSLKKSLSLPENHVNSPPNSSSTDLLAEIMSSQALLHRSSREVCIARDGSLHLNSNSVLPVRNCPNSGPSSPQRSPHSSPNTPQRTDSNSSNNTNGYNYSFVGNSSNRNSDSPYPNEDIASIKPSPDSIDRLTTEVDDNKVELYSDIESLGDNNKDESDEEEDEQNLIIDDNSNVKNNDDINANSAQLSQSLDNEILKPNDKQKNVSTISDKQNAIQKQLKPSIRSSDAKRRPSIKDLFGDSDDDEEDDNDIRQILAEKGTINVHYPIKMNIVLKNSIEKKIENKTNDDRTVESINTKWVSVDSTIDSTVSLSKCENLNTSDVISTESINKWKPIEEKECVSELVEENKDKLEDLSPDDLIDESENIVESNVDLNQSEDISLTVEEEEGEIKDDVLKVRRCRHGRIRKDKNKDIKESENKSRHRSRSDEKKCKNDNNNDCIEVEPNIDDEIKEKKVEDIEMDENENNEKIGWKKLSNTTKMRSYRDGKPKDEKLLFREREVPKKLIKKSVISSKSKSKESNKTSVDRHRDHGKDKRHEDSSDGKHRKHRNEEQVDEKVRHKRNSDDSIGIKSKKLKNNREKSTERHGSRTRSSDHYDRDKDRHHRHHKKRKHRSESTGHKNDEPMSGERGRRHRKHSHHSKKDSSDEMMTGTTSKILRDHSSYADVTPLDSKEIYAEGDRIVINVNFKRDNNKTHENDDKKLEEKRSDSLIGQKVSSKKDDNIYWASPPPALTSQHSLSTQALTTTITRVEASPTPNAKMNSKSNEKLDSGLEIHKKDKVIDESRFLPRSLHQSDVRPLISTQSTAVFGPHTPEGDYDENQFIPTPTQDESQSPIISNSLSRSSSSQSSPNLSSGKDNDVYDPEAPLQSPVDHQSVAVSSSSPQKKTKTPLSPKENLKKPSPSVERPKFSPKDIPKSSPATSTQSIHSPFKSPSVLPQRQMKSSPQKPLLTKTNSLMPPPVVPSIRPTMSSSLAATAAAIASFNPQNLSQLLQFAQSLKTPTQLQNIRQQTSQRLIANNATQQSSQHQNHNTNRDHNESVDMELESPSPPQISSTNSSSNRVSSTTSTTATVKTLWDQIIKSTQQSKVTQIGSNKRMASNLKSDPKRSKSDHSMAGSSGGKHQHHRHQVISVTDSKNQLKTGNKLDQLTVLDDVPSSAVEMAVKEKFIKKLNRQERVIEEVKLVLKPHYQKRTITKEEYKEILRKSVPKICHSKSGEINPVKIKSLIEGYVKRYKYLRKKSKKSIKH